MIQTFASALISIGLIIVNHRKTTPKFPSTLKKLTQKASLLKVYFDPIWQAGENETNTYAEFPLIVFHAYTLAV